MGECKFGIKSPICVLISTLNTAQSEYQCSLSLHDEVPPDIDTNIDILLSGSLSKGKCSPGVS